MQGTRPGGTALLKGARTRLRIVREAARLFNTRGFAGTSVSDVSSATGLEKGGVYNHFATKDALALAAFDYAASLVADRLDTALSASADGPGRLAAMLAVYATLAEHPFLPGGCPILNTAVEADDTHPALCDRARAAMDRWLGMVRGALLEGIEAGAFRAGIDVPGVTATIVAALEGGILLSRLYRDAAPLRSITAQVEAYVDTLRAT